MVQLATVDQVSHLDLVRGTLVFAVFVLYCLRFWVFLQTKKTTINKIAFLTSYKQNMTLETRAEFHASPHCLVNNTVAPLEC